MARPQKQTVEYFSHDGNAGQGRTLSVLYNHFGHEGISAWWLLLEELAITRNHVIAFKNGEDTEYLAAKMHFKPERLKEILAKMAELNAIDPQLFKSGTVWCQNFVDRLESVYKSRKQALPTKPGLSVKETELLGKETTVPEIETELSIPEIPQTKETKETKLKRETPQKTTYGEFKNVLLFPEEYEKLVDKFGDSDAKQWIETLSSGMAAKPNRYKYTSHYAALLQWERRDKKESTKDGKDKRNPQAIPRPDEYTRPENL